MSNHDKRLNDTKLFFYEVNKFSGERIKRKEDILEILSQTQNNIEELDSLSFTAKYVKGLMRILEKGNSDPQAGSLEQVKGDIAENIIKIKAGLNSILNSSDEKTRVHFQDTYFEMTAESFKKLNELVSDLEWVKMYLNQIKRNK